MAKLIFGLNQSLDGYVGHQDFTPRPGLFRHFIEQVRGLTGMVYGRRMYEVMRYWDEDQSDWGEAEREYATVWRKQPKWVVSRSLRTVGPNATLIADDVEATIRDLKTRLTGEIEIAGPQLVASVPALIDEYRLYLHPLVLGRGKPFFAGPRPPLRLAASDLIVPQRDPADLPPRSIVAPGMPFMAAAGRRHHTPMSAVYPPENLPYSCGSR